MPVYGAGHLLSRRHCIDQEPCSMRKVPRDKDAFGCGHERRRIDLRPSRPELLDISAPLLQERKVGRLPGRNQNGVTVQSLEVSFLELWSKAALFVINAQAPFDFETKDIPPSPTPTGHGPPTRHSFDSLLLSFEDLHGIR